MDPVTAAIVAGATAGLASTASRAVIDTYEALKAVLRERFPRVDVGRLLEQPGSAAGQASLAHDLARDGADRDAEVVQLAEALVEAIERDSPQAAVKAGVDLERVKAGFLTIERVRGDVHVSDADVLGGISIADIDVTGGSDPKAQGRSASTPAAPLWK